MKKQLFELKKKKTKDTETMTQFQEINKGASALHQFVVMYNSQIVGGRLPTGKKMRRLKDRWEVGKVED